MAALLVIDDDPRVRGFLRDVLAADGHTVREAAEGGEGLAALAAGPCDLVLCDLFMPGLEGIQTIRGVRESRPGLPVIALSGGGQWGLLDVLDDAATLGATVALPKPVTPAVLQAVVAELLGGPAVGPPDCPAAAGRGEAGGRVCPRLATCGHVGTSAWCGTRPVPAGNQARSGDA